MDAQQFTYWLQGFAELSGDAPPTKAQWKSIREHLGLVFKKVTPPVGLSPQKGIDDIMRDISRQSPATPYRYPGTGDPFSKPPYTATCIAEQLPHSARTIC